MNDESSVVETTEAHTSLASDTPQTQDASEGALRKHAPAEETPTRTNEADTDFFANTGTDFDTDSKSTDTEAEKSELEQLRGELRELREEIAQRDARLKEEARIEKEYDEFSALFPDVSVSSLPDEVWQDVAHGASLAAAYALAEKKRTVLHQRASDSNTSNRSRSAGAVRMAQNHEFSPAEVRAMSSQEVRANLPKIMRSMQKWH